MPPNPLIALVNGRVLGDHGPREGLAVLVRGKRIVAIVAHDDPRLGDAQKHDLHGHLLLPGFIDVQVNGGGGLLFNDDPSVETLRGIAAAHRTFGTTGMLPTLITDTAEKMRAALQAVDDAIEQRVPGILGIHVEGPFLANARKGIHNADLFRLPDDDDVEALIAPHKGPVMLTLAPDQVPLPVIARLAGAGVVVVAGHTAADYATTRAALDAGLCGFTHLYNAMTPLASRDPGVVGAALDDPHSWCGLIVDGRASGHLARGDRRQAARQMRAGHRRHATGRQRSPRLRAERADHHHAQRHLPERSRRLGRLRFGHGQRRAQCRADAGLAVGRSVADGEQLSGGVDRVGAHARADCGRVPGGFRGDG